MRVAQNDNDDGGASAEDVVVSKFDDYFEHFAWIAVNTLDRFYRTDKISDALPGRPAMLSLYREPGSRQIVTVEKDRPLVDPDEGLPSRTPDLH